MIVDRKIKILMTGAGAPGGSGVLRCLQADENCHITVADMNPKAVGRFLNSEGDFWTIPSATSSNFIEYVLNACRKNRIDVVFPLVTMELFEFAKHKDIFDSEGIKVIVSDVKALNIANNKSTLVKHLASKGILTPYFGVIQAGDFDGLISTFSELGYPNRPLCIKPSVSNGSRGVRIIDSSIDKYHLLFNHKPNSLYMGFEELCAILKNRHFPELLVTEVLPGEEFTIDTIVKNGVVKVILPRLRSRMSGGISIEGQFIRHKAIIDYCNEILNTMDLHGPIGIQVKQDIEGRHKILEINPRIQGTSVAALGVGVNLPLICVYQELGYDYLVDTEKIQWGTNFVRFWQEAFYE